MGIVEFLRARIDEDEAIARAASEIDPGPWSLPDGRYVSPWPGHDEIEAELFNANRGRVISYNGFDVELSERTALHITRHDPARVLGEVKAKRAVIELYLLYEDAQYPDGAGGYVSACEKEPKLKALAGVYSDHPDFDPAWEVR